MFGKGQRIGSIRVSTDDQHTHRQLAGMALGRVFTDRASGKDADRPGLRELLGYAREGDTIVVHSMDRLARNVDAFRRLDMWAKSQRFSANPQPQGSLYRSV